MSVNEFRAADAERLLSDPLIKDALAAIKAEIIEQWTATPARDTEGREWIWRHMKVAEKFEGILRSYISDGKIDAFNEKITPMEKVRRFVSK